MVKSIYELQPIDISGRHARTGFDYQDHIGAGFCLDMLLREDLEEIWFETHDDITLLWRDQPEVRVEFVQVKSNNLPSRWSVKSITHRDSGPGSSLLEKSLFQYRCTETSTFRIVTAYDVHADLELLKLGFSGRPCINDSEELKALVTKIKRRLGGDVVVPESGVGVDFWVDNCRWDKRPDDVLQVENHNKLLSEQVFKSKRVNLVPEHRDELYMKLLFLVKEASSKNLTAFPGCYKITRSYLNDWFDRTLSVLLNYSRSDNPLRDKMQDAGLPAPLVLTAEDLHWRYREARLDPDYYGGPTAFKRLEDEVMSLLPRLQSYQYSLSSSFDSLQFHKFCIDEVYKVIEKDRLREFSLPEHIAVGFFYQVTNRCLMRFTVEN